MFKLNQEKFLTEINTKWINKNCPMCGHNNWAISPDMATLVNLDEKWGIQLGGKIMPLVAITCSNCGNTVFVNPLVLKSLDDNMEGETE